MYKYLFIIFVAVCVFFLAIRKDSKPVSALMAIVLFVLVGWRGTTVGPDTKNYLFYYNYGIYGDDPRDFEALFEAWNEYLFSLGLSNRAFLIVCAVFSIGLVLYVLWHDSSFKVLTVTLFLVAFEWSFYLTGLRQALAMGFFTIGVYFFKDFYLLRSFMDITVKLQIRTILSFVFLLVSVLMHTTALFGVAVLTLVFFFRPDFKFYLFAIPITFIVSILGEFSSAENVMYSVFETIEERMISADRYSGYLESKDAFENVTLYLLVKDLLPLNGISLMCLLYNRSKRFTVYEHLYFWLVILANLFHSFYYMFRMRMYLFPMAAVAVATLIFPALQEKRMRVAVPVLVMILYVILMAVVSYANLTVQPAYEYNMIME